MAPSGKRSPYKSVRAGAVLFAGHHRRLPDHEENEADHKQESKDLHEARARILTESMPGISNRFVPVDSVG
jgi:hypothetical protein